LFSSSQQTGTTVATSSENNQIATRNNQVATQNIRPIDFDVQSKVEGNESQIVTVTLEPNQILRAESGGM
jgi:tRNA A37 threonylcarbamoyladenosine synthetase subunit TsaC/SUA5/YrdC